MAVRLLLINAINPYSEVQARFPHLGLGYLASYLDRKFPKAFTIRIVDGHVEREISSFQPDVVGISAVTQNWGIAAQHAKAAKAWGIPVVVGGMHVSALPGTMTPEMDVGVIGEGEETFAGLMGIYLQHGYFPPSEVVDVPGAAIMAGKDVCYLARRRELIEPLDTIPPPARHLLKIGLRAGIFSTRGCPYRCSFCASSRHWQKTRFFSPEYVVEELKEIVARYGVRKISFFDDLMIADLDRLYKLVTLINREKTLGRVKFKVLARANLLNDQAARLLSNMRVEAVGLGLESGNQRVLKSLKGSNISVEDNYAAIVKLHKWGISAHASFIIGAPGETEKEIIDTYKFIRESDLDFFDVYVMTPYPGTPVWDEAVKAGRVRVPEMDWARLNVNYYENPNPVLVSDLPKETIDRLYRKFRRHRLVRGVRRIYYNPFIWDIVKAGMNKALNKCGLAGCH